MAETHETESTCVGHEPCPECGSRDNLGRYDDGHGFCFGCGYYEHGSTSSDAPAVPRRRSSPELLEGMDFEKSHRAIRPKTFQHWKYEVGFDSDGKPFHIANHFEGGRKVGQKIRRGGKKFSVKGKLSNLYGKWLWSPTKRIIITEGELDALSVSQIQGNKWPVVSLPQGAQSAKKALSAELEWLQQFEEVVLMFDMDEPGQEAALKCARLFKPGTVKIAKLPLKDANEMLKAGRGDELQTAIWSAEVYRPDGIVTLDSVTEDVLKPIEWGRSYPWPVLTERTYGRHDGQVIAIGAGTGIGKTDFLTECILWDLHELKLNVGVLMLEQLPAETVKRIAGKLAGKRFHVPDGSWSPEELAAAVEQLKSDGGLFLYDSFGAIDWDTIQHRIRYLALDAGCKHIYLDHLTALAAHADDERTAIEGIMADLAGMAQEMRVTIHIVSHLATPDGKPHEEGGRVTLRHFKGSRSIGYWAHAAIGLERDQQAEDETDRNTTTVRVLKDRYTGQATGFTFGLTYDHQTGRLKQAGAPEEFEFNDESEEIY
jgi:twinkle protein